MKPALTLEEQLQLLTSRQLAFGDRDAATRLLYDAGYYRLSGYLRYFQISPGSGNNTFKPGATFEQVKRVYMFDDELRRWLFDGISILEVVFRSRFAYELAMQMVDPVAYLDPTSYQQESTTDDRRARLLETINGELDRSREPYIAKHFHSDGAVPIWAAIEVLSFGTVSKMFGLLQAAEVVKAVAKSLKLPLANATGTIESLSVLRNVCAHHGRIWNRIPPRAAAPKRNLMTDPDRRIYNRTPWSWIVVLADLVDTIQGSKTFSEGFFSFLAEYPDLMAGLKDPRKT